MLSSAANLGSSTTEYGFAGREAVDTGYALTEVVQPVLCLVQRPRLLLHDAPLMIEDAAQEEPVSEEPDELPDSVSSYSDEDDLGDDMSDEDELPAGEREREIPQPTEVEVVEKGGKIGVRFVNGHLLFKHVVAVAMGVIQLTDYDDRDARDIVTLLEGRGMRREMHDIKGAVRRKGVRHP